MPVTPPQGYRPPRLLFNGHLQTIVPNQFRRVDGVDYERQRLDTPDGDFLDLDWSKIGADRLVIVSHGLEGHSNRPYVRGMVRAFQRRGWDGLAWNFRGCSGEPNRKLRFYHSGATEDLAAVVEAALAGGNYRQVGLVGFSLGGNLTLKYLGELGPGAPSQVVGAAAISVPCDLGASARIMSAPANRLYLWRFLQSLRTKIKRKAKLMPGQLDLGGLAQVRSFFDFDQRYTAPLHGFAGAEDYWRRCSSRFFIGNIAVPSLVLNAANDPFLSGACYPETEASTSAEVHLEVPAQGGHVGFPRRGKGSWAEVRATDFLERASH